MNALVDAIEIAIEKTVLEEWRHAGWIDGTYSDGVRCVVDGKHYLVSVTEEEVKNA